jgi:hypothetical protein
MVLEWMLEDQGAVISLQYLPQATVADRRGLDVACLEA